MLTIKIILIFSSSSFNRLLIDKFYMSTLFCQMPERQYS